MWNSETCQATQRQPVQGAEEGTLKFYNTQNTGILTCMYKSTLIQYIHLRSHTCTPPTHSTHTHFSIPMHTSHSLHTPILTFFTSVLGLHCPITHTSPSLPRTITHTSPSPCTPTLTVLLPTPSHSHSHFFSLHPHTHSSPSPCIPHTSPSLALQYSLFLHSSLWPPSCHGHCPPLQLQLIHQVEKGVVLTLRDAHRQLLEKDIGKKAWLICTSQSTRGLVPCETYLTVDRIDDIR